MQEFIKRNGVTACPSFGTPEFRELNIAREAARAEDNSRNAQGRVKARSARLQKAVRA